ncbi:ditrans,polycis-polyprenyl diphosphate synthase [Halocaridina rubra]|uniref:ditrans,polycis-polyprenyl diphosphate synthase [(2E,6E)-farnesyldiphosphate specific] n=1 Tax=Halocaridina rubra TaxID=373956 RepID=A0AAN9A6B4_HALRR
MDVLPPLFQLLYFVAHFLVSLALSVYDTFQDIHHLLLRLCSYVKPANVSPSRLHADSAMLKKIPEHMGLILVDSQVSHTSQLASVITWCVGYGVKYISLYDAHGRLKQNKVAIINALQKNSDSVIYKLIMHNVNNTPSHEYVSVCNGNDKNEKLQRLVTVNILSLEDGKENIATAARKLSCNRAEVVSSDISAYLLTRGQPDPNVVIIIGEPVTPLGFLPWQIRLTEFFVTPSLMEQYPAETSKFSLAVTKELKYLVTHH